MRAFIDTNVVVDFCAIREPYFSDASIIMEMAKRGIIEIVISSLTFVNVAYIMRKHFPKQEVLRKIQGLMSLCNISPIDGEVIKNAILKEAFDFEDAVQYFSANNRCVDVIITRDEHGFDEFPIIVNTPREFIENCQR